MDYLQLVVMYIGLTSAVVTTATGRECPAFWTRVGDTCFRLVSSLGIDTLGFPTVHHAQITCRQYGGDLAHIKDVFYEQNAYATLRDMSLDSVPRKVYIGLNDLRTENHFEWMNEEPAGYTDWGPHEPNDDRSHGDEDCVVAKSSDKTWQSPDSTEWHDYPCCRQNYITHALCSLDLNVTHHPHGVSTGLQDLLYATCNIVNECQSNPCQNGATCLDDVMTYTCVCPYGVTGSHCEVNMTCPLPSGSVAHAEIGYVHEGPSPLYGLPLHHTVDVTCDVGYSFRETGNPMYKRYNCTENGWVVIQTKVLQCPRIPTWMGLQTNSTSRYPGSIANYSCQAGLVFVNSSEEDYQLSFCNDTGSWEPPIDLCEEKKAMLNFLRKRNTTEASGAVVVGTFGMIFLIAELSVFVLMDLNALRQQLIIGYRNIKSWLHYQKHKNEFQAVPTQIQLT